MGEIEFSSTHPLDQDKHSLTTAVKLHLVISGKSLYENVQSAVKVNKNLSDWFEVHNGVKQGCILSPSLFSMFINDLVHDINLLGLGIPCGLEIKIFSSK